MSGPEFYEYDDDGLCEGDEDDAFDDCALDMNTGQCGKAGSEECDWECPWRNTSHFAGNPDFKPKRKRKAKRP